jgi:pyruvate formate lyase activating enzyme
MLWLKEKCIGCGTCIETCPESGLRLEKTELKRKLELCTACGTCVGRCPALAHEATGWEASVDEIMAAIIKDIPFYDQSQGGVTFSGGEPLMQPRFLEALLDACGRLGIHRAVDTCAYVQTELLLSVAAQTEVFLLDLKHMDSDQHLRFTGVPNALILKNIRLLAQQGKNIQIRIPLIDGVNSGEENIRKSGEFIASLATVESVDLLPYHSMATAKYQKLKQKNPGENLSPASQQKIAYAAKLLAAMGLKVHLGGSYECAY